MWKKAERHQSRANPYHPTKQEVYYQVTCLATQLQPYDTPPEVHAGVDKEAYKLFEASFEGKEQKG